MAPSLLIGGLVLFLASCQDPAIPEVVNLLNSAKTTIEEAKKMGASSYAPELLGLAESELIIGEKEKYTQENKVFWRRDFSVALHLANLAQIDAEKALALTVEKQQLSQPADPTSPPRPISAQETLM